MKLMKKRKSHTQDCHLFSQRTQKNLKMRMANLHNSFTILCGSLKNFNQTALSVENRPRPTQSHTDDEHVHLVLSSGLHAHVVADVSCLQNLSILVVFQSIPDMCVDERH